MADPDSPDSTNGVSPEALQAVAARLRRAPVPERDAVAPSRDPIFESMARAIDRMGPIPGRSDAPDVGDADWDDAPVRGRAPAPGSRADAAPGTPDNASRISPEALQAGAARLRPTPAPERDDAAPGDSAFNTGMIDRVRGAERGDAPDFSDSEWDAEPVRGSAQTPAAPGVSPDVPGVARPASSESLDDVLQQRMAARRQAISGYDDNDEWGAPETDDVSHGVRDALARNPDADIDRAEIRPIQQSVRDALEQQLAGRRRAIEGSDQGDPGASNATVSTPSQGVAPASPQGGPPGEGPQQSLQEALQQQLAARRRAVIGEDDRGAAADTPAAPPLPPRAAQAPPPVPPRDDIQAGTPPPPPPRDAPPPVPPRDDLQAAAAPPPPPRDAPPPPPRDDLQSAAPPPPPRDAPPPPPPRDAPPPPPRDSIPAAAQAKLPMLSDEQNKAYAAQVDRQQATMERTNAFLGAPAGKNADAATIKMAMEMVAERGAIVNVPTRLQAIEKQQLPPAQQAAEVDKVLGSAARYDQNVDRLDGRLERITTGRDPGPDLPLCSRADYEAFANRNDRMRGLLVQADRAMDPKSPVAPDAAMKKLTMEVLNANRYMMEVPNELRNIAAKNPEAAERLAQVAKVMAPMAEIDKRMDAMNQSLKDFSVAQLGDRAPKPLPGLTPDQQAEFADRSARMRGQLNQLDRMMDPKAERQPDAAMKTQTLELLNANRYMLNVPSELKDIEKQNLDPATKQAQIDKLMAPMAVVDKRLDDTAKSINDFYVGKDRPPAQLTGVTPEQNRDYALRSRRMDAMLEGLDRMNDPKLPIQPGKEMQKETLELLRANTYLKELPKDLQKLDAQKLDPAAKQAQVDKLMAPMGDIDQRMGQMDRRMVGQSADIEAAEKRGTFGRFVDRMKEYGTRAVEAVKSIPDRISEHFSPQTPATPVASMAVQMGTDDQHLANKGVGFQTSGKVESIEHKDGQTTVHYKVGAHDEVLKVDEKGPVGEAVDHLKPGDQFGMKIGRDDAKNEVIQLEDKTDNFKAVVHESGAVEKGVAPPPHAPDRAASGR